jgi:hypothetical protein
LDYTSIGHPVLACWEEMHESTGRTRNPKIFSSEQESQVEVGKERKSRIC